MSFGLSVSYSAIGPNIRRLWEDGFNSVGFGLEIWPEFQPAEWNGGFLPIRLAKAPFDLIGVRLEEPIISGFEVWFCDGSAEFHSPMGRSISEFALLCLGAATLANLSDGRYIDRQNGIICGGVEAIRAAEAEVRDFVATARPKHLVSMRFPGWDKIK